MDKNPNFGNCLRTLRERRVGDRFNICKSSREDQRGQSFQGLVSRLDELCNYDQNSDG